jgi:squalene-hopene/tetraprenyl-beta-curcumene cyclase
LTAAGTPTESEQKLLAQTKRRVEGWVTLDSPAFKLLYDFNDQKKKESWGTEAVLNAVILAFDDRYAGRTSPDAATKKAFANLWQTQAADGPQTGSWEWLDFKLEPWESTNARYFGAALAAIAVGTAPGYYTPGVDANIDAKVNLLRGYLRQGIGGPNLHNQTWTLWAASALDGILSPAERKAIVSELLAKQADDGGWRLSSLGSFTRTDATPQETAADGYATGLVLHVLQVAGVTKEDAKMAKGLAWLKANQSESGEWRAPSVNKKRNPATHVGKFMADAATAMAVLALGH